MPLFDLGKLNLNKYYMTNVKCINCNEVSELKIPKGNMVKEYLESGRGKCNNCGCNELEKK